METSDHIECVEPVGNSKLRMLTKVMMGHQRHNIGRENGPGLRNGRSQLVGRRPLARIQRGLGHFHCRMTVIKLADGALFVHSPKLLYAQIRISLDRLGPVRAIVVPSKAHHSFVADYVQEYPRAPSRCAGCGRKTPGSEVRPYAWF